MSTSFTAYARIWQRPRASFAASIATLLALTVSLTLIACSSDEQAPVPVQPPQQAEPESQAEQDAQASQPAQQPEPAQSEPQQSEQPEPEQSAQEDTQAQPESAEAQASQPQEEPQTQQQQQAASQADQSSQTAEQSAMRSLESVRGIVDPSNDGWPREVEGLSGVVSIPAKPLRIITASIGHDEITLALVPGDRLVAVGAVSKDATYSNIAEHVQDKAEVSRDPEVLIAESPDVVVTSPFFPIEVVDALQRAGVPVIQTELRQGPEAQIESILLMGYIFGEEQRAFEFADEVSVRYEALIAITAAQSPQPSVLALTSYSDTLWVAGSNSTEGGVIIAAGGVNAAETAGIEGNQTTSLEGVIAMSPEIIIIAQPLEFGAEEFRQSLLENEALAEVPAIRDGAVHIVESKHFTTLSYWNIRGAEDLARLLWPDLFTSPPADSFSIAE